MEDLEQYTRKEDIIITGLKIERSMAEIVKGTSENDQDTNGINTTEVQVLTFLNEHGFGINEEDVSACHTLGKRNDDGTQKVIIRFANRRHKRKAMMCGRNLRGTNVYVNEHLTKKNGELAKKARDLRRAGNIINTWVRDCKVFIKDKDGKVLLVKSTSDLNGL